MSQWIVEAQMDMRALLRSPSFYIPAFAFPVVFYFFFGIMVDFSNGHSDYLLISYACFGIMGPPFFHLAVSIASERTHGWLTLKLLSPMKFNSFIFAKLVNSAAFSAVILLLLYIESAWLAGVRLWFWQWGLLTLIFTLGTLPFAALGMLIGALVADRAAAGVVNLIYLPMALLSGLWFPLFLMPDWVQWIAYGLPSYHLVQLGYAVIGKGDEVSWYWHIIYLCLFSISMMAVLRSLSGRFSGASHE
ncbi:MAG TPA: ABC transporter permease [Idiomarina baltica]|uniref:ABC transporter permease n=1 Tax=Idiomarina baltica TaxID=190892 RepID=A0A348WN90_9GAMM|nr:ABC transporter permease [Idiomarinaceae bacterium]MEC8926236.1 ABC transporter permease [Pseudomonadota bacterium]HAR56002.1 ABC transporter permease [Idiomarina baltica]|tara:strand:- start:2121 stop:2861 length:741 start_codon:yes stop_codon:yes gene_type:complete